MSVHKSPLPSITKKRRSKTSPKSPSTKNSNAVKKYNSRAGYIEKIFEFIEERRRSALKQYDYENEIWKLKETNNVLRETIDDLRFQLDCKRKSVRSENLTDDDDNDMIVETNTNSQSSNVSREDPVVSAVERSVQETINQIH